MKPANGRFRSVWISIHVILAHGIRAEQTESLQCPYHNFCSHESAITSAHSSPCGLIAAVPCIGMAGGEGMGSAAFDEVEKRKHDHCAFLGFMTNLFLDLCDQVRPKKNKLADWFD